VKQKKIAQQKQISSDYFFIKLNTNLTSMPSLQTPKVVFYQGIKHDFLHHLLCKQDVHRLKPIYPLLRLYPYLLSPKPFLLWICLIFTIVIFFTQYESISK
jgi:hypothetical protein